MSGRAQTVARRGDDGIPARASRVSDTSPTRPPARRGDSLERRDPLDALGAALARKVLSLAVLEQDSERLEPACEFCLGVVID